MNDQINVLKDDIAFMRALAQEGRTPPLLGGAVLAGASISRAAMAQQTRLATL